MAISGVSNLEPIWAPRRVAHGRALENPHVARESAAADFWPDVVSVPLSAEDAKRLVKTNAPKRVFREMGIALAVMFSLVGIVEAAFAVFPSN
jgi:hypothetical protein